MSFITATLSLCNRRNSASYTYKRSFHYLFYPNIAINRLWEFALIGPATNITDSLADTSLGRVQWIPMIS